MDREFRGWSALPSPGNDEGAQLGSAHSLRPQAIRGSRENGCSLTRLRLGNLAFTCASRNRRGRCDRRRGRRDIRCLEKRNFPHSSVSALASARSAGMQLPFAGKSITVTELTESSFDSVNLALFSAGSGTSKKFAPIAVARGAVVVDNSSAFRMNSGVPLVVPEINPETMARHSGIIANPNCAAIISITPLWPIHKLNPIKRLIISTYQAASGADAAAMEELRESTRASLESRTYEPKILSHPCAFNLFSHNTKVDPETG